MRPIWGNAIGTAFPIRQSGQSPAQVRMGFFIGTPISAASRITGSHDEEFFWPSRIRSLCGKNCVQIFRAKCDRRLFKTTADGPDTIALVFVLGKPWRLAKAKNFRAALPGLGLLTVCAVVPIGAWMVWNWHVFGDLTGSEVKIRFLGWTQKSFADWWHHPIFTPRGAWFFASELIASFWHGDGRRDAWPGQ